MRFNLIYFLFVFFFMDNFSIQSQIVSSNGAIISINNNCVVQCNGGLQIKNASQFTNNGTLNITKNSTVVNPGNLYIITSSTVSGDGTYRIEQDWINNATFNAGNSLVHLNGNTQQFIGTTNATVTEFNNLLLSGNGSGIDRRKTLNGVDARIGTLGQLDLTDREMNCNTRDLSVLNANVSAITGNTTFGNEGFISNLNNGFLNWNTNSTNAYLFPLGSSDGDLRYRPIRLTPSVSTSAIYSARFNNYSATTDGFTLSSKDNSIELTNELFYHSVEVALGSPIVSLEIAYLQSADGEFFGIGNWYQTESKWKDLLVTSDNSIGNYSTKQKSGWDLTTYNNPYVLTSSEDLLEIPNVFTPNKDGLNDKYFITSKGLTEMNLQIVNRWGEIVFETNDINGSWDGTSKNGNPCTAGVYFYTLTAKSKTKEYKNQGHITLNSY